MHFLSHCLVICKRFSNNFRFLHGTRTVNSEDIPIISTNELKRVLKSYNTSFDDGYTNLKISCSLCVRKTTKSIQSPSIFINKTTGFFTCSCAKYSGQWSILENIFKVQQSQSRKQLFDLKEKCLVNTNPYEGWIRLLDNTDSLENVSEEELNSISNTLKLPPIEKTQVQAETRVDKTRKYLYFPLYGIGNLILGYKRLNLETNEETTFPKTNCHGVTVLKTSKSPSTTAIIVPTLLDSLIIYQYNISNVTIISLAYKLCNLPQQILPYLEHFDKIILWFGDQINSWDIAKQFSRKLNEKRCLFIRTTENQSSHLISSNQELKKILNSAQPVWHKSITTFASLRHEVFCDLQNIDRVQGIKWKRYPSLNRILRGHRRGELTVLTGPTGCGKTTFMSEYSLDLAMQGVNTLWGSFEIRNARLARTMLQQMAGLSLEENLNQFDQWANEFETLPIYFMTFHGQQSIKVVMEAVEHATYVHDIAHVIIDNVQFMMGMSEESKHIDRFWKQDIIVAAFRTFATRKNCHVTLVIHPRKERDSEDLTTSSIFGGAKASQEADNVLLIQDKRLTSIKGKKYLQVAKNRYSGDLGIMALNFDKSSLSYAQKKNKTDDQKNE